MSTVIWNGRMNTQKFHLGLFYQMKDMQVKDISWF